MIMNYIRIYDRKNKKMYNDLNILNYDDIYSTDNETLIVKGTELPKNQLTIMTFTGIYDCDGNRIYEKDLVRVRTYDEEKIIYISDLRKIELPRYSDAEIERLGSIYASCINDEVNDIINLNNAVEFEEPSCHECNKFHTFKTYLPIEYGNTDEIFRIGDYIKEGLTEEFIIKAMCYKTKKYLDYMVKIENGYLKNITLVEK